MSTEESNIALVHEFLEALVYMIGTRMLCTDLRASKVFSTVCSALRLVTVVVTLGRRLYCRVLL